jgi:hypothetical protein
MNFAPVLPINLYPALDMGLYHLVQAHLFPSASEKVIAWFKERNKTSQHYTILDNGLIELGTADVSSVFDAAALIEPSCVVLPDVFKDAQETYNNVTTYIEMAELAPDVMVVPQGKNVAEWCSCAYRCMRELYQRDISFVVGVPKVLDSFMLHGRLNAVTWLTDISPEVRIHLLGLWYGVDDICYEGWQPLRSRVMGVDSTLPFAQAAAGMYTSPETEKVTILERLWTEGEENFSQGEIWRARVNIAVASRHARHAY